jgi:hypothetical protein
VVDGSTEKVAKVIGKAVGGQRAAPPEGFIVLGMKGPLKEGEVERAVAWARW